ncbi:MAG: agmatinase [Pseudomonadota bacterium]
MSQSVFLGSHSSEVIKNRPAIIGCPLDVTSTYRKGSEVAPQAIRICSESIETYCPRLDRDLSDYPFADLGDLKLNGATLESKLSEIHNNILDILDRGGTPLALGGEHTLTLPIIQAFKKRHNEFVLLHLDAHSDLRESYEGQTINHATVIRRAVELIGPKNLIQLGIRSGTREEFLWIRDHGVMSSFEPGQEKILIRRIDRRPVYLSLDLDVLDPSCFPGVGNPEPGGWSYQLMERFICFLKKLDVIGIDVVELMPEIDKSEVSSITAAKIIRSLLLVC